MSLQHGTRIGPYEVTAQIGEGGMGQVYRATDSNLARTVAIKVLPDAFAQDAERVARFEREARTLAALNHPNIAHVYGLERAHHQVALVMELVDGPTLDERITHGVIPVNEALPIARQIAEALENAHATSRRSANATPRSKRRTTTPRYFSPMASTSCISRGATRKRRIAPSSLVHSTRHRARGS